MDKRAKIAIAAVTVGAGVGVAYYIYKTRKEGSSGDLSIELDETHITWLSEVASKYAEGDPVKALQMLIDHCITASADEKTAGVIFKDIRCNTCGDGAKTKVPFVAKLLPAHIAFIDSCIDKYGIKGGQGKTVRIMCEYAKADAEESSVFSS